MKISFILIFCSTRLDITHYTWSESLTLRKVISLQPKRDEKRVGNRFSYISPQPLVYIQIQQIHVLSHGTILKPRLDYCRLHAAFSGVKDANTQSEGKRHAWRCFTMSKLCQGKQSKWEGSARKMGFSSKGFIIILCTCLLQIGNFPVMSP